MKLHRRILLTILKCKRQQELGQHVKAIVVVLSLLSMGVVGVIYLSKNTTYFIVYVGRYKRPGFDPFHERALTKYLDELNAEMGGVQLKLKPINIHPSPLSNDREPKKCSGSQACYQEILEDDKTIAVIDNTWGSEFKDAAELIREHQIPVININSDKAGFDYGKNAVFLGHDENVPNRVINFSKKILGNKEVVFITETEKKFALKKGFMDEFEKAQITFLPVTPELESDLPNENEKAILFQDLDNKLNEIRTRENKPTVIINTHAPWGNEIIKYLDKNHENVNIIGGPYIIDWEKYGDFGANTNNNSLIVSTKPRDTVPSKSSNDLMEVKSDERKISEMPNEQLFIKRCLDAVSLIRGALFNKAGQKFKADISRADFIRFFHEELRENKYIGDYDDYSFSPELLLFDEKSFEKHFQATAFSYPKQLNPSSPDGPIVPNLNFGLEINNITNIDLEKRSFHADFSYWLTYDENNVKGDEIDKLINFRNEISLAPGNREINSGAINDSEKYKEFKKSADFSMDADFENYPFDTQKLIIELELIKPIDEMQISFDYRSLEESKKKAKRFKINEWVIEDFYLTSDKFTPHSFSANRSLKDKTNLKSRTLNINIPISRIAGSPLKIIVPLFMIGLVAIAMLYIKTTSFVHIGGISVGIFIGLMTYAIVYAQMTPKSNVLTPADKLLYFTFAVVLVILLKFILFHSEIERFAAVQEWTNNHVIAIGTGAMIVYFFLTGIIIFSGMSLI